MEKPQNKRSMSRPITLLSLVLAVIMMLSVTMSPAAAVYNSVYTHFTDVPQWAQPSVAKCLNGGLLTGTGDVNGAPVLNLSEDLVRTIVILDRAGYFGEHSDQVQDSWTPVAPTPTPTPVPEEPATPAEPVEDRSMALYDVYKDGFLIDAPADIQWMIRDFATQYGFPEKIIFGMIITESTFKPGVAGDSGKSMGLCQIQKYWIQGANITHFTDDYRSRNLLDPYDNLLTLMEMWCYARDTYGLQMYNEDGSVNLDDCSRLIRWHASGNCPSTPYYNSYMNGVIRYSNDLVALQ